MEIMHERCCGLDIHKQTIVACLIVRDEDGQPSRTLQTFGTTTRQLLSLADWLRQAGCTQVAMESTGSYWHPVYNLLEEQFTLVLVNALQVKKVPGRKSDVKDAEWIAELLRHGLLRGSFVPARPERELRELTRYRSSLVQERSAEVNRIQKVLEGANIKLASVATDVAGKSGRAMLAALVAGNDDPAYLASLARGRMQRKHDALEEALLGSVRDHQRLMLKLQLEHVDALDGLIENLSDEVEERLRRFTETMARLERIPGVGRRVAEIIVSEVGTDMGRFQTAGHLVSWAGLCPGLNESAGKNYSAKTPKGNNALKTVLVQAALAAGRTKNSYLSAHYRRLRARRGPQKAAIAVAHSLLIIVYHLLADPERTYQDLGPGYFDQRDKERRSRQLKARLEELGYTVTLEPIAA